MQSSQQDPPHPPKLKCTNGVTAAQGADVEACCHLPTEEFADIRGSASAPLNHADALGALDLAPCR